MNTLTKALLFTTSALIAGIYHPMLTSLVLGVVIAYLIPPGELSSRFILFLTIVFANSLMQSLTDPLWKTLAFIAFAYTMEQIYKRRSS